LADARADRARVPAHAGGPVIPLDRLDFAAVVLLAAIAVWVAAANHHYSYDDAFITYRMAGHFATGQGFVYNPGEWHLGSTAAFYGLLLGALGWLTGPSQIPVLGGWISSLAMFATALALYMLARARPEAPHARACGLAAGIFFLASPMMFVTFGGEMPFLLALVAWAFVAVEHERTPLAAALGALATLTRPDGILALGVVLATIALRRRRVPWREAAVAAALLLPFLLLAWHAYGTPLPSTLGAKLAQRDSGLWTSFGRGMYAWLKLFLWNDRGPNLGFAPVAPPTLWLWILAGGVAIWRYRAYWPLVVWSAVFLGAYAALRVPFYHWYAAPAVPALAIAAGTGLGAAVGALLTLAGRARPGVVTAVAAAIALLVSLKPLAALPRTSALNDNVRLYIETGQWLALNTPPRSRVGYYEIGYIGFYSDRPMIDALGLIDPAIAPAVVAHDWARAFREHRPEYILEKPGAGLNTFLAEPWFAAEYQLAAELHVGAERLRVHQRR